MLRKCNFCDDKNEKSIDTSESRYLKVGDKYWHFDCYKIYLTTRKKNKLKEEDAILECLRIEEISKKECFELDIKQKLFDFFKEYYGVPVEKYFFIKVEQITKGNYKGISNPITYIELFEMYSNTKMMQKLDRLGYDKNIKKEDRMNWDLGVMVNEYPKYVKSKLKNKALEQDTQETLENIRKYKNTDKSSLYKESIDRAKCKNENETNVVDIVNDIFDF